MKKTYAIRGLMEFQALIPAGRSVIRVPFTGGSLTGYGVTPATFTTTDAVMQHLIESSPDFKRGRITILRRQAILPDPEIPCGGAVTLTDIGEAREYLAEHCGIERRRLTTADAIEEAARECGVIFAPA